MAWTRGRDGWSGVEGDGEVRSVYSSFLTHPRTDRVPRAISSSNLTFSLSDGWAFVETEDWRKDLTGDWSGCGADGGKSCFSFLFFRVWMGLMRFVL